MSNRLSHRNENWLHAVLLKNRHLRGDKLVKAHFLFECSQPGCKEEEGLRMTPSGIYCREHYLHLPSCSVRGPPCARSPACWAPRTPRWGGTRPAWGATACSFIATYSRSISCGSRWSSMVSRPSRTPSTTRSTSIWRWVRTPGSSTTSPTRPCGARVP